MTLFRRFWDKLLPADHHRGMIEWTEECDVPAVATVPMPIDPFEDERLWQHWIELDSRPAPLGENK